MNTRTDHTRLVFSVAEAADALGIGRTLAYELAQTGRLGAVRVGGRWLVPKEAVKRLLSGEEMTAAEPRR